MGWNYGSGLTWGGGGAQSGGYQTGDGAGTGSLGDLMAKFMEQQANAKSPMNDFLTPEMFAKLGLSPEQAQMAMLKQFGLNAGGGIGGGSGSDGSAWARLAFDQERAKLDDMYKAGDLEMKKQQMGLNREELSERQRANMASDKQQGRQNDIGARNADISSMNTARGAYSDRGQLATNAFTARENALQARSSTKARGAENQTNLTNILGNLGAQQQKLGLDILSTPRNAIPAFLMARGQGGAPGMSAFAPQNVLGFDPSQMQGLIQQSIASAGQVGNDMPEMEGLDMNGIMQALSGLAERALGGMGGLQGGDPNYSEAQWPRIPSNGPGSPVVDNLIQLLSQGGSYGMGGGGMSGGGVAGQPMAAPRKLYDPASDRDPWESPNSNTMAGAATWRPTGDADMGYGGTAAGWAPPPPPPPSGPITWGGPRSNSWFNGGMAQV